MSEDLLASGPPTLEDVARAAGVSRATVSRVINRQRKVSPEVQEAIDRAIEATGYVPNRAARSLVTRRTGSVAVVVSGAEPREDDPYLSGVFADPFFGRLVGSFLLSLRPHDVHPVLMLADSEATRAQAISYLRHGNADGALIVSTHSDDPLPEQIVATGRPAVLFARPPRPVPISFVDVANADGARLAAEHLYARGCRRTAVVSGPLDVPAAVDRLHGFQDALARRGHPYVRVAEGNFTFASGEAATATLLDADPDLDGVFAANDLMAQGAIRVLRARGRRVPDDVAVVGFDDSSSSTISHPTLTTVRQPLEEMAAQMARLLLERIADPAQDVRSVIFDPTLVVRESA